MMIALRHFVSDTRGTAAEFALVLPAFLILLFATIDVGRFMWFLGQAEKATMQGARYAAVTDMVPSDLADYSFATTGGVPQGDAVPQAQFPGVSCSSSQGTVSCVCLSGGTCAFGLTANDTAFTNIATVMRQMYGGIGKDNVRVDYTYSGLGFAGNPNGPDVDPIITVSLQNMQFRPLLLGTLGAIGLPGTSHSLTQEDGVGDFSF